jgi:ornithine cyclodeaminase/alanine dehydrogenase-like protein (mu-crystallin family)
LTLIIDNPTVEKVLTAAEVIDALDHAHREMARGRAINSPPYRVFTPRQREDFGEWFPQGGEPAHHNFTSLTGAIESLDVTCDRVNSDFITYVQRGGHLREIRVPNTPDRKFCGLLYVYSSRTGELLAIIHDGYLQKFRVAGTAAIGTRYLGRKDAKVMALIGTGWQAQAEVLCHAAIMPLARIKVYSPTPGKKEAFAKEWSEAIGVEIVTVESAREAVRGADFVVTATNAPEPVVLGEWLEPGQFITGVKDLELDLAGWERCNVLTANRHGPMWVRYAIGGVEVIPEHGRDYWGKPSTIEWEKLPLLGDVMVGNHPGRTSDDQITGLILRGDGIQFTAVGARIYKLCKEQGLGHEIPTELFLQDEKYIP